VEFTVIYFGIALAFFVALIVIGAWAFYEIRSSHILEYSKQKDPQRTKIL